eukprot:scaffold74539_cov31-Tisochrysis_lutea.AAC.3
MATRAPPKVEATPRMLSLLGRSGRPKSNTNHLSCDIFSILCPPGTSQQVARSPRPAHWAGVGAVRQARPDAPRAARSRAPPRRQLRVRAAAGSHAFDERAARTPRSADRS